MEDHDIDDSFQPLNIKKSNSTPPPGLYQSYRKMNGDGKNVERMYEIDQYLKKLKNFNPRLVDELVNDQTSYGNNTQYSQEQQIEDQIGQLNLDDDIQQPPVIKKKEIQYDDNQQQNDKQYCQSIKQKLDSPSFNPDQFKHFQQNQKQSYQQQKHDNCHPFRQFIGFNQSTENFDNCYQYDPGLFQIDYQNMFLYNQMMQQNQFNNNYNFNTINAPDLHHKQQQSIQRQNEYEKGNQQQREQIVQSIVSNIRQTMVEKYDNYLVQKIFEVGEKKHRKLLFREIQKNFDQYYNEKYSSRVLQKVYEVFYLSIKKVFSDRQEYQEEYDFLYEKVIGNFKDLIINENGNFIIQKCLENYKGNDFLEILERLSNQISQLCVHKYGCLVVQKIIDISKYRSEPQICQIIEWLQKQSVDLSQKEYSNYIVQHMLEKGDSKMKKHILESTIKSNFIMLSCNQFASNVIEKSIRIADQAFVTDLWNIFDRENIKVILKVVNNKFGNFVVQRMYEFGNEHTKSEIYNLIQNNKQSLSVEGNFVAKFIDKKRRKKNIQ